MVSSELPEVLGVSDRIVVMREGRIAGELPREQANEHAVLSRAAADERRRGGLTQHTTIESDMRGAGRAMQEQETQSCKSTKTLAAPP